MESFSKIFTTIQNWWSEFTLQTKLMAVVTLMVSLLMSGVTFWAVNDIQTDARLSDTRFGRDLGLLLAANVSPLVAKGDRTEVARVSKKFFESSSSIRYILYADPLGDIYYGIPSAVNEVKNSLSLRRRIQLPENPLNSADPTWVKQHNSPQGEVTDVFVRLDHENEDLGILAIGINPNPTAVASSSLTLDVTTAVFVSIWMMVILGAASNVVTITRPIKELVVGVQSIAGGNFKQRIDLPFGGELGELIRSFNEMAKRLESYEEQNIEELTAEKAKLETLVYAIADGAILLDADLKVILANPAAIKILGWEDKQAIATDIMHILPPMVNREISMPLLEIVRGEREGAEFRITSPSESGDTSLRFLIMSVLSASNTIKGIAMTVQDITREVELNAAQSRFISNVSHELRTPLFNIKSFIETLHEYGDELTEEQKHEFLDTANRETDRLTRLVNDVLDLSRLESGRQYRFDATELHQTIEQTLRTYQLNARDKGIELQKEIDPDIMPAWANYDLLLQVLGNLVGNALKFTSSGGKVLIKAYNRQETSPNYPHQSINRVRVEVSDTGAGISPEDQKRIFDRFFRIENRVHTLEGTGLGLSIVRNIIEKHHSKVHVHSELGVGTTFWFDLSVFQDKCDLPQFLNIEASHQEVREMDREIDKAMLNIPSSQSAGSQSDLLPHDLELVQQKSYSVLEL